jgi:hypothetical protein
MLLCSESKIIGKTFLDWNTLLDAVKESNADAQSVTVDQILKVCEFLSLSYSEFFINFQFMPKFNLDFCLVDIFKAALIINVRF